MKKFINHPGQVVEEMLRGLVALQPGVSRLDGHSVLFRSDAEAVRDRQVAVISGGGSGHEPAHAGYVGAGMLSAAVLGEVFTSPSSDSVFAAIKAVTGKPGAVLVVKNYTGDRLNFGLAAEMARAEGIPVEVVIVADDVALRDTTPVANSPAASSRGLAGTVLIHKILGAAAQEGQSLSEVANLGRAAAQSLATMGVSLSAGTAPAVGKPGFELAENEMELGLGIHGEPGVERTTLQAADRLVETLLSQILKHGNFGESRRVAVLVNNLGATTHMELAIVAKQALSFLEGKQFQVERLYAGTFLSSLDMAGISLSLLGVNDEWLRWLDAETGAPAWPNAAKTRPGKSREARPVEVELPTPDWRSGGNPLLSRVILAACEALIKAERELTELDRITGDGDLGTSIQRAAVAVGNSMDTYPLDNAAATLKALGHTLRRELGGSSGPLYGILFLRCGTVLEESGSLSLTAWTEALRQGCQAISDLGGAHAGDRTMLDALIPFTDGLNSKTSLSGIAAAVKEAEKGVDATAQMKPRHGRSSYLGDRVLGHPDPGAKAVAIWLRAACEALLSD